MQNPSGLDNRYNNQYNMTPVDADSDGSTSNSSSATVTMPAGSTVLFAGLYWGAQSTSGNRNRISFKAPGASSYSTLTASRLDATGADYQGFTDYPSFIVAAAGAGEFRAGNVQARESSNDYAGWALVVAYEHPSLPGPATTVFDGYGTVRNRGNDRIVDIPISGFLTPPFGAVNAEIGVIAYEGDGGLRGDQFLLDGVALSTPRTPPTTSSTRRCRRQVSTTAAATPVTRTPSGSTPTRSTHRGSSPTVRRRRPAPDHEW